MELFWKKETKLVLKFLSLDLPLIWLCSHVDAQQAFIEVVDNGYILVRSSLKVLQTSKLLKNHAQCTQQAMHFGTCAEDLGDIWDQ